MVCGWWCVGGGVCGVAWAGPKRQMFSQKLWPPKFPYHTGRRGGPGSALFCAFPQGPGDGISSGVASPAPLGIARAWWCASAPPLGAPPKPGGGQASGEGAPPLVFPTPLAEIRVFPPGGFGRSPPQSPWRAPAPDSLGAAVSCAAVSCAEFRVPSFVCRGVVSCAVVWFRVLGPLEAGAPGFRQWYSIGGGIAGTPRHHWGLCPPPGGFED